MKNGIVEQPMVLTADTEITYPQKNESNHGPNFLYVTVCSLALSTVLLSGVGNFQPQPDAIFQKCVSVNTNVEKENLPVVLGADTSLATLDTIAWEFAVEENAVEDAVMNLEERAMLKKKVPGSFIASGFFFAGLFAFFTHALISGAAAGSFMMNPVYLFELAFGFLGLTITVLFAIREWRNERG